MTAIYNISNNDAVIFEANLSWLAYNMTGETSAMKALFMVGPTASNGKSTMIKMFEETFEFYVKKLRNDTFCTDAKNKHKVFHDIKNVRCVYMEELRQHLLDGDSLKDFIDGYKIGSNEVLWGTTEDILIKAKLSIVSNSYPTFNPDAGLDRRGFLEELKNRFVDKNAYASLKATPGVYLRDPNFISNFRSNPAKKLALVHILLPYAVKFYQILLLGLYCLYMHSTCQP